MYIDLYSLQSTVQSNQIVKWENVTLLYILRKPRAVRRLSRAPTLLLHNFTFQSYTQLYQAYFSLVINRRGYGRLVHTPTCAHTHTQQHTCTHKHPHMCTHTHTHTHTCTHTHTVTYCLYSCQVFPLAGASVYEHISKNGDVTHAKDTGLISTLHHVQKA